MSIAVLVGVSYLTPPPEEQQIVGLTFATVTDEQTRRTRTSWNRTDVIGSAVVLIFILAAYLYFNG